MNRRDTLRITAVAGLGLAFLGGTVSELLRRGALHRVRSTRVRMGTAVSITVIHQDRNAALALIDDAFAEIERLERILSRQQPGTAVHRLNRFGILAHPPAELVTVLERAYHFARLSDGAFDITVLPVLELYARRFGASGEPPRDAEVNDALKRVNWQAVTIDDRGVAFEEPGMSVTVDGIAKGYVVDQVVAAMTRAGAEEIMIGAGGDIASSTRSASDEWRVGVRDPDGKGTLGTIRVRECGVASSGDYMQAFTPDRQYHHIIDPRSGRSPGSTSAVTVIASSAMDADAISTAAFVLGPTAGIALIDELTDVAGMVVSKDGAIAMSKRFAHYAE